MLGLRHRVIGAGFAAFRATGLHHVLAPVTRGRGAILTFHHVRPFAPKAFAPNRGLEITPAHLDAVLTHLAHSKYTVVPLDEVPHRLTIGGSQRFVAITFDDGYRDTWEHALPVLERHAAPFTVFVTTGFAERSARLWWLELERAVAAAERLRLSIAGRALDLPSQRLSEKARAFDRIARHLRQSAPETVAAALDALGCRTQDGLALVERLCLDWAGIARLAAHPLATIGCHTLHHPCLAALPADVMRHELAEARILIETRIGRPVASLAYPYGSAAAAGPREFAMASNLGFASAVTTRPGVLWPANGAALTALPRLSVNGLWPHLDVLDVLLSGAPFALKDLGSRRR